LSEVKNRRFGGYIRAIFETSGLAAAPLIGIPLAFAAAGHGMTILAGRGNMPRDLTICKAQKHRLALVTAAATVLGLMSLCCTMVYGFKLAHTLEHKLGYEMEIVRTRGHLHIGQVLEKCALIACARATIIRLPTDTAGGVGQLTGFVMHDEHVFGWSISARNLNVRREQGTIVIGSEPSGTTD
jgi:hypothetical protein